MAQNAQQAPASASRPLATGAATVVVACKIPQGHKARLHVGYESTEVMQGLTHKIKKFRPTGEEFIFKGPARAQNEGPRVVTSSGFALTFGVPADFWDKWYDQHKELDAVKAGLIFAYERRADVQDAAKERKDIKTGLERIDPTKKIKQGGTTIEHSPDSPVKIGRLDAELDEE
jgi:hypothetical protein